MMSRLVGSLFLVSAMSITSLVSPMTVASAAETAIPAEKNPPGDIPDSQVFVTYTSKDGYALKVPEGWARKEGPSTASFVDKLDGVVITIADVPGQLTKQAIAKDYVAKLKSSERAVKVTATKEVKLPAGTAVRIDYQSNSEPNAVTNKQIRLENQRFLFVQGAKMVDLRLYAPLGADNVDQWKLMSESFSWQ